jgi:hypothetical protein
MPRGSSLPNPRSLAQRHEFARQKIPSCQAEVPPHGPQPLGRKSGVQLFMTSAMTKQNAISWHKRVIEMTCGWFPGTPCGIIKGLRSPRFLLFLVCLTLYLQTTTTTTTTIMQFLVLSAEKQEPFVIPNVSPVSSPSSPKQESSTRSNSVVSVLL